MLLDATKVVMHTVLTGMYSTCKVIYLGSLEDAKDRRPDEKRHPEDGHQLGIVSTVPDAHVLVTLSLIGRCTNITLVVSFNAIVAICSDFRSTIYPLHNLSPSSIMS